MQKRICVLVALSALLTACATNSTASLDPAPTPTPFSPPTPTATAEPTEIPTPVFSSDPYKDGMTARRNGDYARAAAAFALVLNSKPAPDLASEAQFRLGEAYWLKNDYAKAIATLSSYLQSNPKGTHAPETNYFLADSYRATKDYANALASYRVYRDQSATLVGDTDATIADVMVVMGDSANAIAQYDRALEDKLLATATRINILQRAADVYQGRGQPALAAARYDAALDVARDARTRADLLQRTGEAYAAANQLDRAIQRWNSAVAQYPEQPGAYQSLVDLVNRGAAVDDFQRGLVDYYAGMYDPAIAAFQRELKDDSSRAADAHYFIASSYSRKSALSQAITEYDIIIKSFPKSSRVDDAYLGKGSALGILGRVDEAVTHYKRFATSFPEDANADDALWRAAQLLDRVKRYDDASDVYVLLQTKYPSRDHASESLFLAGFDDYRNKDYKSATTRWQALVKDYPQSIQLARTLFWLGKAAQVRAQNDAAKNYWTQAANATKNYYAWRAGDILAPKNKNDPRRYDLARYSMDNAKDQADFEKWLAGWSKSDREVARSLDAATRDDLRFRRGSELLRLARTVEARVEFASLIASKQEDPRALYALALYTRDNNLFSLAIDCADRIAKLATSAGAPDPPRFLLMLRYPTYYADLVVAEAKTNQIDPLLYLALIKHESSFNTWATAEAGERGLGQVIPPTARGIASSLGVKNFVLDTLFLPVVGIHFGLWFFAQNLKQFDDPIYALAAYNAGGGRAKNWQKPDIDLAVEEIDIASTNLYVRLIYGHWRQYQEIYK